MESIIYHDQVSNTCNVNICNVNLYYTKCGQQNRASSLPGDLLGMWNWSVI